MLDFLKIDVKRIPIKKRKRKKKKEKRPVKYASQLDFYSHFTSKIDKEGYDVHGGIGIA